MYSTKICLDARLLYLSAHNSTSVWIYYSMRTRFMVFCWAFVLVNFTDIGPITVQNYFTGTGAIVLSDHHEICS